MKQKKKQKPVKPSVPLSPSRKRTFTIVLILLPIIFFVGTELVLRWTEYGGNLKLVVTTTMLGKEYYTLNREVAMRYFSQSQAAIPEVADDLFEIQKRPETKRIFMLGESTMAGYPFEYNATAPRLLQDRLKQLLPQYNVEVINAGLAATNSYTVVDFAKELTDYAPDAFVVYVGHNEFYGALGVGSTEYLGQWRWMINTYLKLRNLRLFLLVRDGIVGLKSIFQKEVTPRESTLMEMMVKEKTILYNSEQYITAKKNYEANMIDLIALCRDRHIPLVLSTLTSNLRDQKPLLSTFGEQTSEATKNRWHTIMNDGSTFEKTSRWADAAEMYRKAITVDTMQADAHFALARCLDRMGDMLTAKTEYIKARDYDGLRFRAASDFNTLLYALCTAENVPLADADQAFNDQSIEKISGNGLFLEHLHPNFDGYFLLAKTFFQTLADNNALIPKREYRWENQLTDEQFKEKSGVTKFDIETANCRIYDLMHHWPFVKTPASYAPYPTHDKAGEIAVQYAKRKYAWSKARYTLAEWYSNHNEYSNALNEYHAISKVMWYHYLPLMYMGDMYREMNDTVQALQMYSKALVLDQSPFVKVRLGMLYYNANQTDKAIEQFEGIFANGSTDVTMNAGDRSLARYFLAAAYWKKKDHEKTISNLQVALQLDSKNADAKQLLDMLTH